jgi:hypothetical protein
VVSVALNVVSSDRIVAANVVSKLRLLWSGVISIVGRYRYCRQNLNNIDRASISARVRTDDTSGNNFLDNSAVALLIANRQNFNIWNREGRKGKFPPA